MFKCIQKPILMNKNTNLVEIYYLADEFCKEFDKVMEGNLLEVKAVKNKETVNSNSIMLK